MLPEELISYASTAPRPPDDWSQYTSETVHSNTDWGLPVSMPSCTSATNTVQYVQRDDIVHSHTSKHEMNAEGPLGSVIVSRLPPYKAVLRPLSHSTSVGASFSGIKSEDGREVRPRFDELTGSFDELTGSFDVHNDLS